MKGVQILVFIGCLLTLSACHKDQTKIPGDCGTVISYSNDIVPIIQGSCMTGPGIECHSAWITEHANIVNYIKNDSWQNEIWVSYTMPKIPNAFGIDSLTASEVQLMRCWVDQGYPEN